MDGVCAEYVCDHGLPEGHDSSSYHTSPEDRACVCNRAHHVRASFFLSERPVDKSPYIEVCLLQRRSVDASSRPRDDHRDGSRRSIAPRRDASVERVRDDARNRTDRTFGVCPVGARARDVETGRARRRARGWRGAREKRSARRDDGERATRGRGGRRRGGASERE